MVLDKRSNIFFLSFSGYIVIVTILFFIVTPCKADSPHQFFDETVSGLTCSDAEDYGENYCTIDQQFFDIGDSPHWDVYSPGEEDDEWVTMS